MLIDTGEHFKGANADEIIQKLTHSKRKTGLWGRQLSSELKQYRNGQTPTAPIPPEPTQAAPPQFGADADALARTLGFSGIQELASEWQGVQQRLQAANEFAKKYQDEQVSESFIAANPDFPGDQHAIDTLI